MLHLPMHGGRPAVSAAKLGRAVLPDHVDQPPQAGVVKPPPGGADQVVRHWQGHGLSQKTGKTGQKVRILRGRPL